MLIRISTPTLNTVYLSWYSVSKTNGPLLFQRASIVTVEIRFEILVFLSEDKGFGKNIYHHVFIWFRRNHTDTHTHTCTHGGGLNLDLVNL